MNPFTRFLNQWSKNDPLSDFVSYWDRLEVLMVQVHRKKIDAATAEPEFAQVWPWLRQHYDGWVNELRPYWQQTKAAGEPTQVDPFQLLLDIDSPAAILGDWQAMQHLPAAREALNVYIQTQAD